MDAERLRRRALRRLVAALAVLAAAGGAPSPKASAAAFDYLHVEAGSGASAGGHVGVRFGDQVYHFQHEAPGFIAPAAQSWESFDRDYRGHGNRPIHVLRIGIADAAEAGLRAAFDRRIAVQRSQRALYDDALADVDLLDCLDRGAGGRCGLDLAAAGYVAVASPSSRPPALDGDAGVARRAVAVARAAIERVHGTGYVARRRRALGDRIRALAPRRHAAVAPFGDRIAAADPGLARLYSDLLREWLALAVLAGDADIDLSALRRLAEPLAPAERMALVAREAHLHAVAVALASSGRGDRGYALLVDLARLAAARLSLRHGRPVVLDTYTESTASPPLPLPSRGVLEAALGARRRELAAARRQALLAAPGDEMAWSRFEAAANVALELEAALAGAPLRRQAEQLAPARRAPLQDSWPRPVMGAGERRTARAHAVRRLDLLESEMRRLYEYDLVRRNCVTEIFRTFASAGVEPADIGGWVDVDAGARFVPFVSAGAVRRSLRLESTVVLPSYRGQRLRRDAALAGSWLARLREETAPVATLVPFDAGDEVFLFFSTDAGIARPLLGIANVAFGAAAMAVGAVAAPFDDTALLAAGARGVLYSAPELAFVSLRKGTVPVLPDDWDTAR